MSTPSELHRPTDSTVATALGLVTAFLLAVTAAGTLWAATKDESGSEERAAAILSRHREASGADQHLAAIRTLSMRGVAEAGVMRFALHERRARPGRLRLELSLEGKTIIQATDGQDAWWLDPVMASGKVESMPESYEASFRRNADFDDFYLDAGQSGVVAVWTGEQHEDDGRVLDEVRVTYADDSTHTRYFDRQSGLYVRKRIPNGNTDVTADFADFREVAGVLIPFRQAVSLGQSFVYEAATVNEPFDDALFTRPADSGGGGGV